MYQLRFNILQLDFARYHIAVDNLKNLKLPSLIHLGQIGSTPGTLKAHLKGSNGIFFHAWKFFPCMEKIFHAWKKQMEGFNVRILNALRQTCAMIFNSQ